jgi:hypothetical protein
MSEDREVKGQESDEPGQELEDVEAHAKSGRSADEAAAADEGDDDVEAHVKSSG